MIRLTWLQFRLQAAIAVAALSVLAIALAITGPHLANLYHTTVANCAAQNDCDMATSAFLLNKQFLQGVLNPIVLLLPALIGIFWGAPLVAREIETGTFRLVWTQSISRGRWMLVKLGIIGLTSMVVAGLFSLMVTWWSIPFDTINQNRFTPIMFSVRGLAPIGYAVFAFTLGVTIGLLVHRTLPAMGITLVIFVGVRLIVMLWVRPYFVTPLHVTVPDTQIIPSGAHRDVKVGTDSSVPGDWVISDHTLNGAGQVIGQNGFINGGLNINVEPNGVVNISGLTCPNLKLQAAATTPGTGSGPNPQVQALVQQCVTQLNIRDEISYQPKSRFWAFQWYETVLFCALSVVLAGFCFWWMRYRLA